nr:malto-oligosyltrehalose trehalohydrolase [Phragmitibacter flavus]
MPGGGFHFRVWAPRSTTVKVLLGGEGAEAGYEWMVDLSAEEEGEGYFSGMAPMAEAGMLYRLRLDGGCFPDPASRFQPFGPHGPSQLVDPAAFEWADQDFSAKSLKGDVIYEMHIGTYTVEGTWNAAMLRLPELAELGVSMIEVMPVAEFPGLRGWGYDGVNLFAPTRLYGTPDDFREFVDEAHRLGMGVMLDVVYNHLGPDGNYLPQYSEDYFHKAQVSDWGDTLNFDDQGSGPVRELFCSNAAHWISEYHLDGLRLDAVHQIFDESDEHLLKELTHAAKFAAGDRKILVVAENEHQQGHLARAVDRGGFGLDGSWSDDFHHSTMVSLTGRNDLFFADYDGSAQELISVSKWGFLYQGQCSRWSGQPRGTTSLDLEPWNFVVFLQNHDQVANPAWGRRLHGLVTPGALRAVTAWLLLGPNMPMLFQGQEFASSSPFVYFSDLNHDPALAQAITLGREKLLHPFARFAEEHARSYPFQPQEHDTFLACKLNHEERHEHATTYRLHRDLIHLRNADPLIGKCQRCSFDAAVIGPKAMALRYFGDDVTGDRLVLVNLGNDSILSAPDPLLAPPAGWQWKIGWSSETPDYGGGNGGLVIGDFVPTTGLPLEAESALVLVAQRLS